MAGLGTLAAGVAHELNNPAAAVRSSAETVRKAPTADATFDELAALGLAQSRRAS